jgi:hypothetical protein
MVLQQLRRLRQAAGQPSLRELQDHAAFEGHEISLASLSALLNGKGRPRRATVDAFVAACCSFARRHRPPIKLDPELANEARWRDLYAITYEQPHRVTANTLGIVPRQLPMVVSDLVGRAQQLEELNRLLAPSAADTRSRIVIVTGVGGIGKTTLALTWAHDVADHFPDGQLYINLHGFGNVRATTAEEALRSFLTALGLAATRCLLKSTVCQGCTEA